MSIARLVIVENKPKANDFVIHTDMFKKRVLLFFEKEKYSYVLDLVNYVFNKLNHSSF